MRALTDSHRRTLENFLGLPGGYVFDFSDRTFGEFVLDAVAIDIHAEKYMAQDVDRIAEID